MSLERLLEISKPFPPGYIGLSVWPRSCGNYRPDHTYDSPRYEIPDHLRDRLLGYFEEDVYFSLKTDFIMKKEDEDGVVKVSSFRPQDHL